MSNNIIDIIGNVVDSMRETGVISSIVDNLDGTYTVTVTDIKSLANDDVITIESGAFAGDYVIKELAGLTFKIIKTVHLKSVTVKITPCKSDEN